MPEVFCIYVEKKPEFNSSANSLLLELKETLKITSLKSLRQINRYLVENISKADFELCIPLVFSEPAVDNVYKQLPQNDGAVKFACEYLPGQFDQRADSAAQCIQLLIARERPTVRSAKIFILEGELSDDDITKIKNYLINPIESRETSLDLPQTLDIPYDVPDSIAILNGFTTLGEDGLQKFIDEYSLAMDMGDIKFCQNYFKDKEKRSPSITEIRMIDTYWSDHCRHTTFLTEIENIDIDDDMIKSSFEKYKKTREQLYKDRDKPICLMDLATIAAKKLKDDGILINLDESEEINACSVKVKVDVDGVYEDWLMMFKNETHNHPTEIEPFGGAATCLGGAIRDPLSGRSYVYQAMRVTGSGDPTVPVEDTIAGKLPQKKITTTACAGYSSYGNQIGLSTGLVREIYHEGYKAKRLEIGAVVGAAPAANVIRETPSEGDNVLLLGGRTGRDGCGGATGSSKSHDLSSLEGCAAEVQKGNAPEERKLQRLFRNKEVTGLIKRCNDFGAGGISVAIGELADGLSINLDAVLKKYDGLDGTELAISESQERMAVVVAPENVAKFMAKASEENLECYKVAEVTNAKRLTMHWKGNEIVNLSRDFINSNGAKKTTDVKILKSNGYSPILPVGNSLTEKAKTLVSSLNVCSQKGLIERFDSSIGAGTVLMPFGGKHQTTPSQVMAAKFPVLHGETTTASIMSYGFDPYLSEANPYLGAQYSVVSSVSKLVAAGAKRQNIYLTFQEYFERMKGDPARFGKPFSSLLGAFEAQLGLSAASIGGKDSMSGSFEDIDVPPTLVSFAIATENVENILSCELKSVDSFIYYVNPKRLSNGTFNFKEESELLDTVSALVRSPETKSIFPLGSGGIFEALFLMSLGNEIGVNLDKLISERELFGEGYGGFVIESTKKLDGDFTQIGNTTKHFGIKIADEVLDINLLIESYNSTLESVFPIKTRDINNKECYIKPFESNKDNKSNINKIAIIKAKPTVLIPVFPGTNCEYDTAKAFEKAGADPEIFVIKNLSAKDIEESAKAFKQKLSTSEILMLPGGFSGGDEPDGSGKFITAFLRNPMIKEEIDTLLKIRKGLILGICNGFQALIKLGLVPFGEIIEANEKMPTLTYNTIGRHQSKMVRTKIVSTLSPWLGADGMGEIHTVAISHGEGRFVASDEVIKTLIEKGQVATQYVDLDGKATMDIEHNPNGSYYAIEGITSEDGLVFGKMGHSERCGKGVFKNIIGNKEQLIFKSGVDYFK